MGRWAEGLANPPAPSVTLCHIQSNTLNPKPLNPPREIDGNRLPHRTQHADLPEDSLPLPIKLVQMKGFSLGAYKDIVVQNTPLAIWYRTYCQESSIV